MAKIDVKGIKCDNPSCNYINVDAKVEEYDKWLNKQCPKCGEILLTEADYNNVKMLIWITEMANKLGLDSEECEDVRVKVKMDGTGKMEFEIIE